MFDPNQPLPDFQTQQEAIARQRMIADLLRKQAMSQQQPEGRMVGNQYVKPHWAQFLPALLDKFQAGQADRQAAGAEQAYGSQVNQARQQWQSALPQTTAAIQGQPGIDPAEVGGEQIAPIQAQPAQPVTTAQILKHTLAGMNIPGNEKAAGVYNQGALGELNREDIQAARKETLMQQSADKRDALQAQLQARKEDLETKLADTALSREQQAILKRERGQVDLQMNANTADARRYAADQARAAREVAGSAEKASKPLAHLVHKDLADRDATASAMQDLKSSFKPEYAGVGGFFRDKAGAWIPGGTTDTAEWWKNYRKNVQLIERHASFGGTLTPNEQASWRSADIEVGMNPELVQKNLATRANLAEKVYEKARQQHIGGGHNVEAAFPSRGLYTPPGAVQTPTSGPVTKEVPLSPAEQARLEQLRKMKAGQ